MGANGRRGDRDRCKFHLGLTAALLKFAGAHFALSKLDAKTGKTRLQTLNDIRRQTGVVAPELAHKPCLPIGTVHIWNWFEDLDAKRTAGFSINPLTWSDMHAYFALTRVAPAPWELAALRKLDEVFINSRITPVAGTVKGAKALKNQMTGKAAK